MQDHRFLKKFQVQQDECWPILPRKYATSESELREIVYHLIQRRERTRDAELEKLAADIEGLIKTLERKGRKIDQEEITCLKDTLALQKKLVEQNGEQGDGRKGTETRID